MPEIISNTSPIQYLFQLGLLDLLPRLYGRVLVPPDRRARRFADLLGVTYTGTLGVLLRAKRKGLLERLEPVCGALEERGFRLSPATRRSVLSMAGE